MKRITVSFAAVLFLSFGVWPICSQANAEDMNFTLVSMVEKMETVAVTYTDGVVIGVVDRKGLSRFDNGDIATTACGGTYDAKKGGQGYSSLAFDDGSTLALSWEGPTSSTPAGGAFGGYLGAFEYANGNSGSKGSNAVEIPPQGYRNGTRISNRRGSGTASFMEPIACPLNNGGS